MKVYPSINTALLSQAAATADARLWIKFPSLQKWIDGQAQPTVKQLADFAKTVHIPFGFFFLDKLPKIKNTIPLFRTNSKVAHFDYSYELSETIKTIQKRQQWLIDYLQSEQFDELSFVGRFKATDDYTSIANDIRKVLQLPVNWTQFLVDKHAALKYLITKAEDVGIYVAMNGVVGNSSKNLNPDEFKGFVLSHKVAPYIFINGKDYPAAKIFTFVHELAHIWLDATGAHDIEKFQPANNEIEKLCDSVAAELLVAKDVLISEWNKIKNHPRQLDTLERFFKVSKIVIARRLLDLGIYSKKEFFSFYNDYKAYWESKKEHENGGGSFYNNQPYRVGIKFFETINAATASGKLLYTDAYKLTNLYGTTFSSFKTHLER